MPMQIGRKPYELLVRWDADGKLLGAHIQWSNVVTNDDGSKQIYPITVEPVALRRGQRDPDRRCFLRDQLGNPIQIAKMKGGPASL